MFVLPHIIQLPSGEENMYVTELKIVKKCIFITTLGQKEIATVEVIRDLHDDITFILDLPNYGITHRIYHSIERVCGTATKVNIYEYCMCTLSWIIKQF